MQKLLRAAASGILSGIGQPAASAATVPNSHTATAARAASPLGNLSQALWASFSTGDSLQTELAKLAEADRNLNAHIPAFLTLSAAEQTEAQDAFDRWMEAAPQWIPRTL